MTVVLAAVDESAVADDVLAVGHTFADLLDADLQVLHVRDRDPIAGIVEAGSAPGVALVVIGARRSDDEHRLLGHVALAVVAQLERPVLVVPPAPVPPAGVGSAERRRVQRVLVPLEGSIESSAPVADALEAFHAAGVELVLLHVFDVDTVPRFWDQSSHADESYAAEFASRWCDQPAADLHLRRGAAPEVVVEVARAEEVDLVALAWTRDLGPGRAAVVRAALAGAEVPVLLVPVPAALTDPDRSGPSAGGEPRG